MSNLVSMVLELSANVARFQSDMGKAVYIAQRSAEQMTETFKNVAKTLGIVFSVDKLVEFGKHAIDVADEMGKMAQKVGISVEALSALQVQAKLSGIATDQLQTGLSKLAKNAAEAAGGSKQQAAAFAAIGVSVKDAAGNLKPMEVLLGEVSSKFATYRDSAAKTALAQQFLGKSGAELIPYLNELGQKSLPEVIKQAEEFGAVISTKTAKQAEEFNDNITKLKTEAAGFANAIAAQVLPNLVELTKQMVDAGKTTDSYASSAGGAATGIKAFVLSLIVAKETVSALATAVFAVFDAISTVFNAGGQVVAAWAETTAKAVKAAFTLDSSGLSAADAEFSARVKAIGSGVATALRGAAEGLNGGVQQAVENSKKAYESLFGSVKKSGDAVEETGKKFGDANAPLVANAAAADKASKAAQKIAADLLDMAKVLDGLSGKLDGPYNKAWNEYASAIDQTAKAAAKYKADGVAIADIQKFISEATALATQRFREQTDATYVLDKSFDSINQRYSEQKALIGLTGEALLIETEYQKLLNEALKAMDAVMGPLTEADQKRIESLHGLAEAQINLVTQTNLGIEAAKGWQSIWSSAANGVADTFAKVLVNGGNLFKGLRDLAKQTVEQIIAYFAKLSIINPILNSIFGGAAGFSLLPSLASAGGVGGGATGGGFDLFSASSWVSAGKNLASGFSSLWGGQSGVSGVSSNLFGTTVNNSGAYTFTPSMLGSAITIGGGLLSAYHEYKAGGGVIGSAAYGLGTITAGGAIAGIASGAGAAAGAAGALGTVGLGAIPIVGWVALAAMLIDKFSGGKLFGTGANKFQGGTQTETISATGGNVTDIGTFKGQKAFFGGSYYKDKSLPVDPAAQKAADDFFAALKKGQDAFATSFGVELTDIVGGTFKTTFDKNGKVTGTSSTVLGVTRSETEQQFAERLQADSFLKVLDKMGLGASAFVEALQDDADKLFAGVQDFAQATTLANTDLANGFKFLALSQNATLVDIIKFTEGLQAAGESLTQTYARLATAQTQYNQFVSQFAPAATYTDPFEAAFSGVYHQMLANIDAANKLAIAAGASGAAQQDLTNIQAYAAGQMAQLISQLEQSAQSLAFSLGLTTQGSLDEVNGAISDIIKSVSGVADPATDTSKSLNSFGSAITSVARSAADATNLLLGNLSPLNDQQKLQIALQGLRAGTVTQEQVLTIGRNLFASSEAYNSLFKQVLAFPGQRGGSEGGSVSRWSASSASSKAAEIQNKPPQDWTNSEAQWASTGLTMAQWDALSEKDKQKLEDLLTQQATLKAAKNTQDFQTLAEKIAEIASAKGESFQKALEDMGIKQEDIEKGLGLKSDADLAAYADALQKQLDSAGENTTNIIAAINMLPQGIANAITGKPVGSTAAPARPAPPSTGSSGASGSTSRTITDDDAEAIGRSVGRYTGRFVDAVTAQAPRNLRPLAVR